MRLLSSSTSVVRDRLRRNPTFFPPDMQSMLAYDLPVRGDPPRRQVGSRCFDALVYQRALFPLMPGRFAIPPAQLVYSLPLSASFFSREETHELQTDSTVIVAVEPPTLGTSRGLRRCGRQPARRGEARHEWHARRRSVAPHAARLRHGQRQAVSAPVDWSVVGIARQRRRARSRRHDGAQDRRHEGIRLGADAADRRRARSSADSIFLLQSGFAALRSGGDRLDARSHREGVARERRHGAHRNAPCASHALSRTVARADSRASRILGIPRARPSTRVVVPPSRHPSTERSENGERSDARSPRSIAIERPRRTRAPFVVHTPARSPSGSGSRPRASRARARWRAHSAAVVCRRRSRSTRNSFSDSLDEAAFSASGVLPADAARTRGAAVQEREQRGVGAHALWSARVVHRWTAGDRRRDRARNRRRRSRSRRSIVASRRTTTTISSRRARRSLRRPWPNRARLTRGQIWAPRRGPLAIRRAASPRGSARFVSSRSRPTCATASSWRTRSRGRPPASSRQFPRRGCSISPPCSGASRGEQPRIARDCASNGIAAAFTTLCTAAVLIAIAGIRAGRSRVRAPARRAAHDGIAAQ